jgi:hypothetical protein
VQNGRFLKVGDFAGFYWKSPASQLFEFKGNHGVCGVLRGFFLGIGKHVTSENIYST